ncbi:MAG TPA: isoprenylcysteine carboxylmethyltransferase family protein [Hyphomonadaceae bacterium]|jgi:protein-S-isoprenylcysteine O-methyltransferase Ste14|nr:isoprenylcysteine carboxylmethyltransferase family protein [Hyphomonadaceae bacterium]
MREARPRKARAIAGSIVFFFLAPGIVAFLIPWAISGWPTVPLPRELGPMQIAGGALGLVGLAALIECFARFALDGLGTPAPVAPTKTLVVTGLYRHVRNPMYVAVVAIILAHALWFESWAVLGYAGLVWLAFTTFVAVYEEPTLRASFGAEYDRYCKHVGRWIPRLNAWKPE